MVKQNFEKITQWQKENTDFIRFRSRKNLHLPERIQMAVDQKLADSRQAFCIAAILEKLEHDGIPDLEKLEHDGTPDFETDE